MDKLSNDITDFLEKTSTKTFLAAARQFVDLVEIENIDRKTFYRKVHVALVDLYASGLKLGQIDLKYSSANSNHREIDADFFRDKIKGLVSKLGDECFYWEVFDPTYFEENESKNGLTITDNEPSQGWLVDDFADIYKDLKIELTKIENPATDEVVEHALWQLKWGFTHHWGQHCINALRAFHYLWFSGKQP